MQLHLPRPFIPSGFLPICQSANLPIHPSTWPRRPFTLDTRQLAPTRRTRRLSRGHSIVTQPAPFLPPTKPQSEPVPFLCCSLAWNALGLLTDCRLAYPNSTHTSRDRHPVQPWTRGPLDQTTQIAIHTYIHTYTFLRIAAPLCKPPAHTLTLIPQSPTAHSSTAHNKTTSQSRLPPTCRPACPTPSHGLEAARGRERGNHAYTGPSAWAHHPRALHRAAACRASRAVRPAVTSIHIRDTPAYQVSTSTKLSGKRSCPSLWLQ